MLHLISQANLEGCSATDRAHPSKHGKQERCSNFPNIFTIAAKFTRFVFLF